MLLGTTVIVETKTQSGKDSHGNPVYDIAVETVGNVLAAVGPTSSIGDSNRPEGVSVAYTLYFPKSYGGSLEKARVWVYGDWFDVIGDPRPWLDPEPPGDWNRTVEVTSTHG